MGDSVVMASVVMDEPWLIFVVLGVLAAYAAIRLVLRHYFPPDT
jgi:hypothetical protein